MHYVNFLTGIVCRNMMVSMITLGNHSTLFLFTNPILEKIKQSKSKEKDVGGKKQGIEANVRIRAHVVILFYVMFTNAYFPCFLSIFLKVQTSFSFS